MFKGLSSEQAPPIWVPFRFFISVPIFGIFISIIFFSFQIDDVYNRYSYICIAAIHLFTLGILSMTILGALQQMLPVLAGVSFKKPTFYANIIHTSLVLGTIFLVTGFIFVIKTLLLFGVIFLAISFGVFFIIFFNLIFSVKYSTSTVETIKLFAIAGVTTILFGIYLAIEHVTSSIGVSHYLFVNIHILFASFGFSLLLIMGVSFQVIPMFYVSLEFPKKIQKLFPKLIITLLFLYLIITISSISSSKFIIITLATIAIIFSFYALHSLNNRRRPIFDVTLWYWKLSMYCLILIMTLYVSIDNIQNNLLAILFIFGFLYPLLHGMIYKIIPFLSWFHLSSSGYFMIPNLRDYIKEDNIKLQFYIYFISLLFFIISVFTNQLFLYIGSSFFLFSNILFLYNLISAILKYTKITKTDSMTAFK